VWNLATQLAQIDGLDLADGWMTEVLDLGAPFTTAALTLSVHAAAGVEMISHRFVFAGACAYLEPP
jgi:hypothetical protein